MEILRVKKGKRIQFCSSPRNVTPWQSSRFGPADDRRNLFTDRPHFNCRDKVEFSSGLAEAGRGWAASIKLGSMLGRGTGCHGLPLTASLHSGHAQPHSSSPSITISTLIPSRFRISAPDTRRKKRISWVNEGC